MQNQLYAQSDKAFEPLSVDMAHDPSLSIGNAGKCFDKPCYAVTQHTAV